MMKRMRISLPKKKVTVSKKKITAITAITTLLSATAAFAVIKTAKKTGRADKSEFETVLDGLVKDGTITQDQEVAIQSAITTAKEVRIANGDINGDIMSENNGEFETFLHSSKPGTLTRLKKTFKVRSQQLKKRAQEMTI